MATSKEVIESRLRELENCLRKLGKIAELDLEAYLEEELGQDATERNPQIAIQCVLDIGTHIIAGEGFKTPSSNEEVIKILGEEGILPIEFARNLQGMASLRNLLVHEYLEINNERIYSLITRRREDFIRFAEYIHQYLESANPQN
jgi:uncharacterized protein YutE (UPF0331/DUF86 family)